MRHQHKKLCAVVLLSFALAACGRGEHKPASQVAARVNSDEITVHQVNNVLARAPNLPAEAAAKAKHEIVDRLIEEQLAKQQAIEKKLDRSPGVVQAIEAARSEILARAYLQQLAAAQAKPTPDEVKKYYAAHPELFSERRLYVLEEIALQRKDDLVAPLRERVAKAKSMQEIGEWLKAREVQYMVNRGARAAEQIPLDLLPQLSAMKDGDIQLMESEGRLDVVRRVASKPAPVDEATATPRIEQFLFARRSGEIVAEEMKRLKSKAKIEYVGEFAQDAPKAAAAPVPAATGKSADAGAGAGNVEKAVRGLR